MNRKQTKQWKFKKARVHFSKIFRLARTQGPQKVVRNNESVVVLAAEEYERLIKTVKERKPLVEFFAESPLVGSGIDLERAPDFGSAREEFGIE